MNKGGVSTSQSLQNVIRLSGLIVPLILAFYTFSITKGWLPAPGGAFTDGAGYFMTVLWVASGVLEYIFFANNKLNILIRLVWFQVIAALYLLLITGYSSSPFVTCWLILSICMYAYYRYGGLMFSLILIWLTGIADALLNLQQPELLAANIGVAAAITITGIIIVSFMSVQERDDEAFESSRKAESMQRESLLTLINNLSDAVIATDKNGVVDVYNAATLGILDTNSDIKGKKIDELIKLHDENGGKVKIRQLLKSSTKLTINDSLRTDMGGEEMRVELTYAPIRNPGTQTSESEAGYIVLLRDITKMKSLEEERDEFISVVSHELRTPIAITEGAIDNAQLIFKRDASNKESVEKTLEMAHEQVLFLSRMVNDLSTLSRAERGVADAAEQIDVMELAQTMFAEYEPQAKQKGLSLSLHVPHKLPQVQASRLYLQELLQNFITNAIKYTKEGTIDFTISVKDGVIDFSVKDSGIGISKADQEKIFQKFYRSEDYRTRETGGTGLGLYVAAKLAHKLNTQINVISRLNHGSTFSFAVPALKEESKTD